MKRAAILLGFYLVLSALTISTLKAQSTATEQQGLLCKIYNLGSTVYTGFPEITGNQLPNQVLTVKSASLADYNKTFPQHPFATFLLTLEGNIQVKEARSYIFKIRVKGLAKWEINGKELPLVQSGQDIGEKEAEIQLKKGANSIKITHLRNAPIGYKEVSLWWNENEKWEYVPESVFSFKPTQTSTDDKVKQVSVGGITILPGHDGSPLESLHPAFTKTVLHNKQFKPMVGGLDFYPDGRLVITTWDSLGQVFIIHNASQTDSNSIKPKRIAWGLAEPLGVKVVNNRLFVLQKQELTELIDLDGDEVIDQYKTICNGWGVTANFHEFSFGLEYKDGFFYAALAIAINPGGRSTIPQNPDRGKVVKIGLDGSFSFVASGLRTPNGIGKGFNNQIFIADNQGDWLPSCKMVQLKEGAFYNNYSVDPYSQGKKEIMQPVVWFPQNELGNSNTQPISFSKGPYKNQMLIGDVTYGGLQRVFLEEVKGQLQGCVFKFSQGLNGGTNRLVWGPDSALYVGEIGNPGNWGQYGKAWFGLEKLSYNGKSVFEPLEIRAKANGFVINFTEPLKLGTGQNKEAYSISNWEYKPTIQYGGAKENYQELNLLSITVATDRKSVFIELEKMEKGKIYYLNLDAKKFQSTSNNDLWVSEGYYNLNEIPDQVYQLPKKIASKSEIKPVVNKTKTEAKKPIEDDNAIALIQGPALLEKRGCRTCHAYDKKILGPAYKEVANRYRKDPKAFDYLVNKVINGGAGAWGDYAMASQQHIPKADIQKMVRYILTLK